MNRYTSWIKGALLVFFVGAVYAFAFPGHFHMDDVEYITRNPLITGTRGLAPFWFTTQPKDYYPLTFSVLWLEWRLWGGHAAGYLAVNIALHALNVVLLWRVLRRLNLAGAWLAALLFALHPVNVLTVAWLAELKSMLAMLFALLVVLASFRFEETRENQSDGGWRWYFAALGLFLLALFSKSAVVTLPIVLLLINAWRRGRFTRADVVRSIPFFALSAVFSFITIWFQSHRVLDGSPVRHLTFFQRTGDAACALWFYFSKALCPMNLMLIYPNWVAPHPVFWQALAMTGWVGLAVLLWRFRQFGILVALAIYAALLLPILGFFDQGFYAFALVSDHWQYFGLAALLVLPAEFITKNLAAKRPLKHTLALAGTAVIFGVLLPVAAWRASLFSNPVRLWRDSVSRNPNNWVAHFNLGLALKQQGNLVAAIPNYRMALEENPRDVKTLNNLGTALMQQGDVEEALPYFQKAVRLMPDLAAAHNNLGTALARLGHLDEALVEFREAARLDPDSDDPKNNLAKAQALISERNAAKKSAP